MIRTLLKKKTLLLNIILLGIIIFAGFLALRNTFSLSLFGDDWLTLFNYRYHIGEWSTGQYNALTFLLIPYGSQEVIMGSLAKIFGYNNSLPYYIISFLLRSGVSIAIYIAVLKLSRNLKAAFISGLFFLISSIGMDTTNWVFNMSSYAALICVTIFIFFFIKSQVESKLRPALYAAIFYYLAFLLAQNRAHGMPILAISLDVFLVIKIFLASKQKWFALKKQLKIVVLRQLFMLAVLLLILLVGTSGSLESDLTQKLASGLQVLASSISQGNLVLLLHPFMTFGKFFLPDQILQTFTKLSFGTSGSISLVTAIIFFFPFAYLILRSNQKWARLFLVLIVLWSLIVKFILQTSPIPIESFYITPAYFGGYLLIFWGYILFTNIKKSFSNLLFASIALSISGFLFPWLWYTNSVFESAHRYLIFSSLGIALFFGTLLLVFTDKIDRYVTIGILLLYIGFQLYSTNTYFSHLATVRNSQLNSKIWMTLPKIETVGKVKQPLIFYFEGDNNEMVYDLVTWGFSAHIGIIYNINEQSKLPIPLAQWSEAVEATTRGENLPLYGFPAKPVPINNFYAFKILNNGEVLNTTDAKRKELSIEVRNFKLLNK